MKSLANAGHISGKLSTTSGTREAISTGNSTELSIRNWALVRPNKNRSAGKNSVSIKTPGYTQLTELTSFTVELPDEDETVYKIGWVMGFTAGQYANLKACEIATQTLNGQEADSNLRGFPLAPDASALTTRPRYRSFEFSRDFCLHEPVQIEEGLSLITRGDRGFMVARKTRSWT
ncbi:hypothetical protein BDW62DRAFT_203252 [Aspergillus aurantiobrunneus]